MKNLKNYLNKKFILALFYLFIFGYNTHVCAGVQPNYIEVATAEGTLPGTEVRIIYSKICDEVTPVIAAEASAYLKAESEKKLRLSINGPSFADNAFHILAEAIASSPKLVGLHVHTNLSGTDKTELENALARNRALEFIQTGETNPDVDGSQTINLIEQHPNLRKLYLANVGLNNVGIIRLANYIGQNKTLVNISIYAPNVNFNHAIIDQLGSAMANNLNLKTWELISNRTLNSDMFNISQRNSLIADHQAIITSLPLDGTPYSKAQWVINTNPADLATFYTRFTTEQIEVVNQIREAQTVVMESIRAFKEQLSREEYNPLGLLD